MLASTSPETSKEYDRIEGSVPEPGSKACVKGPWMADEDAVLAAYVMEHGEGQWNLIQHNTRLRRCGKSCRLRWANHLRPDLKRGPFSAKEEAFVVSMHSQIGNKWAKMAAELPGRTDNEIKNFWNTHVKRRMRAGLPPHTQTSILTTPIYEPDQPFHSIPALPALPTLALSSTSDQSSIHNALHFVQNKTNGSCSPPREVIRTASNNTLSSLCVALQPPIENIFCIDQILAAHPLSISVWRDSIGCPSTEVLHLDVEEKTDHRSQHSHINDKSMLMYDPTPIEKHNFDKDSMKEAWGPLSTIQRLKRARYQAVADVANGEKACSTLTYDNRSFYMLVDPTPSLDQKDSILLSTSDLGTETEMDENGGSSRDESPRCYLDIPDRGHFNMLPNSGPVVLSQVEVLNLDEKESSHLTADVGVPSSPIDQTQALGVFDAMHYGTHNREDALFWDMTLCIQSPCT